jgi:hypothetical protein
MTAKQFIAERLNLKPSEIRVRHGRGTARAWLHVFTPKEIDYKLRRKIENELVKADLCGQYLPDSMPGQDEYEAKVNWSYNRG